MGSAQALRVSQLLASWCRSGGAVVGQPLIGPLWLGEVAESVQDEKLTRVFGLKQRLVHGLIHRRVTRLDRHQRHERNRRRLAAMERLQKRCAVRSGSGLVE